MIIGSIGGGQCFRGSGGNVLGPNATVRGDHNTVTGPNANVHGNHNIITGPNATVWGSDNIITGPNCRIMKGDNNRISGVNCRIFGNGKGNQILEADTNVRSITVTPNGTQINLGTVSGGMFMDNRKKEKKTKKKKRERDPQYVEGPVPGDIEFDKLPLSENDKTCVICLERAPCCVSMPCMHADYCVACARQLCFGEAGTELREQGTVKCVTCRAPLDAIKRIFL